MKNGNDRNSVIVAVPLDAVGELEREGLASPLPVFRGAAIDAVVTVGMDSAALVTLLQAPDSVRAFAAWIRDRCSRSGDSTELNRSTCQARLFQQAETAYDSRMPVMPTPAEPNLSA